MTSETDYFAKVSQAAIAAELGLQPRSLTVLVKWPPLPLSRALADPKALSKNTGCYLNQDEKPLILSQSPTVFIMAGITWGLG